MIDACGPEERFELNVAVLDDSNEISDGFGNEPPPMGFRMISANQPQELVGINSLEMAILARAIQSLDL